MRLRQQRVGAVGPGLFRVQLDQSFQRLFGLGPFLFPDEFRGLVPERIEIIGMFGSPEVVHDDWWRALRWSSAVWPARREELRFFPIQTRSQLLRAFTRESGEVLFNFLQRRRMFR